MPIRDVSRSNDDIDELLAQDLEKQAVTMLSENLAAKLRDSCDKCNDEISRAWDTIQDCMARFRHSKERMVNTLIRVEGHDRANRVLQRGLADMVPQKYGEIMAIARSMSDATYPSPLTSPQIPNNSDFQDITARISSAAASTPSPALPVAAAATSPKNRSFQPNADSADSPKQPYYKMKRSHNPVDQPYPPSKKKKTSQPTKASVDWWDVEGAEYIFQYAPFGSDWFVIRCDRGKVELPFTFKQHPLKDNLALEHFNSKKCKYHDSSRLYTEEDIMTQFGHRVSGDQLNQEWVKASNKRLEADTAKAAATGKAKLGKAGMA